MEENIKKLEDILGEKYEDWTQETLAKLVGKEEAIELFTPELVVHLILNKTNDKIIKTLLPVKFGFDIRSVKSRIEEELKELKENNGTREKYQENILSLKEINNPIYKTAVYLTEVASFDESYDVSKEETEIRQTIVELKELMNTLELDEGFQVILEILDILFPLREVYFQRYNIDLLKDDEDIEILIKALNKKSQEMMEIYESMQSQDDQSTEEEETLS
jgi:hypothetical protein